MLRRTFIATAITALAVMASPVFGQSTVDSITSEMQRGGFNRVQVRRTLLGRIRIVGESRDTKREIVLNPNTGLILRDFTTAKPVSDTSRDEENEDPGDDDPDTDQDLDEDDEGNEDNGDDDEGDDDGEDDDGDAGDDDGDGDDGEDGDDDD